MLHIPRVVNIQDIQSLQAVLLDAQQSRINLLTNHTNSLANMANLIRRGGCDMASLFPSAITINETVTLPIVTT